MRWGIGMTKDASSELSLQLQNDRLATLGVLSAGLAHELNNPLGYVSANLRFLSREILDLKAQLSNGTKSLEDAAPLLSEWSRVLFESIEGVQSIGNLVRDMKGFARSDSSPPQWFELQEVLESSLRIVWHELKHRICLEKHVDAILPCIEGNPLQMQQVFVNLLVNAAQAMDTAPGESGKVEVALTKKDGGILVTVKDNGRGIPAEYMEKIFQPFFTSKPSGKGTGLGLFICRQLVMGHGGHIHVESQLGEGTTVRIWLPVQSVSIVPTEEYVVIPARETP